MKLSHTCIITEDVGRLRSFYQEVLQIEPTGKGAYVEFRTEAGTLSLFSLEGLEKLAPGLMQGASNNTVILEFQVEDVDKEYERLKQMSIKWMKPPTTQPWGNRSIYFRDPDGNPLNLYTRVDPESA